MDLQGSMYKCKRYHNIKIAEIIEESFNDNHMFLLYNKIAYAEEKILNSKFWNKQK